MNMDFERARFNMVEQQIRPWDVLDQDVLDLLFAVKRENFVPPAYRNLAFADIEVPLGNGQTMLAPKVEARMLQALAPRRADKVLQVGAGSGYLAALLGARADEVHAVEIDPALIAMARSNLERAHVTNVSVEQGDAVRGWAPHAPYDAIVLTGSVPVLPHELLAQLKVGGRLCAIVGDAPAMSAQLVTCTAEGAFQTVNLFETNVAPLANAPRKDGFVF
jgi:protein-L-isoaspartate(D-aspartate) O-methyltransferase